MQVYKQRVREQQSLIAKAELTKERLLLITSAMRPTVKRRVTRGFPIIGRGEIYDNVHYRSLLRIS